MLINDITVSDIRVFLPTRMFSLLNYTIWDTLQEQNRDVHGLQERIVDEWDKLDQRLIDKAIGQWPWRKRLPACVVAGGGQFEHKT